jgi:hypothetical protein
MNAKLKPLFFCLFCLFTFCSGGRGKLDELKVPDWVLDPYSKTIGVDRSTDIAGVGIAQECGDLSVEISEAEDDARLKIAEQIQVNVNSQVDTLVDKSSIAGKDDLKKSFKRVVNSSVQVAIKGAGRRAIYKDMGSEKSKSSLYVLLSMSKKDIVDNIKEDLLKEFNKDKKAKDVIQNIN